MGKTNNYWDRQSHWTELNRFAAVAEEWKMNALYLFKRNQNITRFIGDRPSTRKHNKIIVFTNGHRVTRYSELPGALKADPINDNIKRCGDAVSNDDFVPDNFSRVHYLPIFDFN